MKKTIKKFALFLKEIYSENGILLGTFMIICFIVLGVFCLPFFLIGEFNNWSKTWFGGEYE